MTRLLVITALFFHYMRLKPREDLMSYPAFFGSLIVVLASGILAWLEGNFNSAQMAAKGLKNGFPFLRHTAMWGDLLLVTPALGIMCKYASQWTSEAIVYRLLIAFVVSIALHIVWSKMTTVQEHILAPGLIFTASGLLHAFYLAGAVAIALLFYNNTPLIQTRDVWLVTALLMAHLPLANAFVDYMKNGKFDLPSVIGTIMLMVSLLAVAYFKVH